MMLESRDHPSAFFLTLTYADTEEKSYAKESVDKRELQLFIKLLRRRIEPCSLRYVGVGEYGSNLGRPHYHLIVYTSVWISQLLVQDVWAKGHVDVKLFGEWSASYLAGYIISGADAEHGRRIGNRSPEFTIQSLKPGVGYGAAPAIAAEVLTRYGVEYVLETGDIPTVLRVNGKLWPIGSYLKKKVYDAAGLDPAVVRYNKDLMRITTPGLSSEEVALREQRRKHGAFKARESINQSKWKKIL